MRTTAPPQATNTAMISSGAVFTEDITEGTDILEPVERVVSLAEPDVQANQSVERPENHTGSSTAKPNNPFQTGEVREPGSSSTRKGIMAQLPLIIGVAGGVFVLAVVVSLIAFTASRKNRRKQQRREEEDQMNIIKEFVETSLNG